MQEDRRVDVVVGAMDGPWRALTTEDLALLNWGLRARARWEQARTLLLLIYGPTLARVTIAATRGEEDFDDESYGCGGVKGWTAGADWREYEDQPFRATDAAGNLLDVELTLPYWREEALRADTIAAQAGAGSWRRPLAPPPRARPHAGGCAQRRAGLDDGGPGGRQVVHVAGVHLRRLARRARYPPR